MLISLNLRQLMHFPSVLAYTYCTLSLIVNILSFRLAPCEAFIFRPRFPFPPAFLARIVGAATRGSGPRSTLFDEFAITP